MEYAVARGRAALVLLGLVCSAWPAWALAGPLLRPADPGVEPALAAAMAWLLLVSWGWLALTGSAVALEASVTGHTRRAGRLAPRVVRLLVAGACGAGAAGGLVAPALADPPGAVAELRLVDGLLVPDRVEGAAARPRARVVVKPGDTLSGIASEHGTEWPALYARNRSAVGPDPDLIRPGLRLTLPHPTHEGSDR